MLEGLEVSEVGFSEVAKNKDERTDSDFWTKILKKNPKLNYARIGDCLITSQYGISIEMNEAKQGYPIYRMNEIHNMLCDFDVDKNADISPSEMQIFKLNDRDVLFNRTNSYEWVGRTGLYRKVDERAFVFASYLVRFCPDQTKILPEYLATFLSTKYGVSDIKRRSRQSINQTNVNPEEVKEIDIPLLGLSFQGKLKNNFDKAYECLKTSETLYAQAEQTLLEAVGLADFKPSTQNTNIKTFAQSFGASGRLDAEYYQQKYEEVMAKIVSQTHAKLKDVVTIKKSIEPGSDAYADEGLPFIRVSDFSKTGLTTPDKYISSEYYEANQKKLNSLKPKQNTILFSKDGSVGAAYLLREDLHGVTSGAILHLSLKRDDVLPEYFTLVLNSKLVQMQAERDAGGSIILHWRVGEIENVILPIIDLTTQTNISQLVQQSFSLKAQSEHLLSVAKRAVEMAIEHDEAAAMHFIENSTN